MNSYLDYWKDENEEWETLETMQFYGGSFVEQLVELYRRGDPINKMKLINTFKDYFDEYKAWPKEKGFTLIELLVVGAIVMILIAVLIIAINPLGKMKNSDGSLKDPCEMYRYSTAQDLPVGCWKYFDYQPNGVPIK